VKHAIWRNLSALLPFASTQNIVQPSGQSISTSDFDYLEEIATVTDTIRPYQPGQIFFQGSWWRAVCGQNLELATGTKVCVVGRTNITCIVKPFVF
jgi:membrane protein implicated in regulation of membrane protease activity